MDSETDARSSNASREFQERAILEMTIARLLSNPYDVASKSPNITLAKRALAMDSEVATEVMMLLYYLEEDPCMKALVLSLSRLPPKEQRRIAKAVTELAGL